MKEFMQQEIDLMKEEKSQQFWRIMEVPELSLAPSPRYVVDKSTNSSSSESETNYPSKKRKFSDHPFNKNGDPMIQTSVDLQLKDPLPLDWEQCLDLEVLLSSPFLSLSLNFSFLLLKLSIITKYFYSSFISICIICPQSLAQLIKYCDKVTGGSKFES